MRILIATPYDLSRPGGVNQQAVEQWRRLNAIEGVEAHLLGPGPGAIDRTDGGSSALTVAGKIRTFSFNGAESHLCLDWGIRRPIRALLETFRPDLLHLHEPFAPLPHYYLLHKADVPAVGTFHTYSETSRGYFWGYPLFRWVHRKLAIRTAVSGAAREFVERYYGGPTEILPNGVSYPTTVAEIKPAQGSPLRLLFLGRRTEPRKGYALLLRALTLVRARLGADAILLEVAGPCPEPAPSENALPVKHLGVLTDKEKAAALERCDVLVLPSTGGESFGLTALEAMARGRAVVAFSIRGYRDWMRDGVDCWLAGEPSAERLAETLEAVARNPGEVRERGNRARETAADYRWEALIPRWVDCYERALALGGKRQR